MLKLSPNSIKNQEFSVSMRGYNKEEVRTFLEELSNQIEGFLNDYKEIKTKIEEYDKEIQEYRKVEKSFQKTIIDSREAGSRAVEAAKKKANQILSEAEIKANLLISESELKTDAMIKEANEEADYIRKSLIGLKEEQNLLISRIQAMVYTQERLLKDLDSSEKENNFLLDNNLSDSQNNDEINFDESLGKFI